MSAIKLTIDGQEIEVAPGTTILEAARQLDIDIPTFCHDPELPPNGACRICVVEVEKARALVASCVAPAGPDMVVHTESERVINARKNNLHLLLANHHLDCITCEKTGDCKLQDYCYRYGVASTEFEGDFKNLPYDDTNEFFLRDMNKCILCGICVGKCQQVVGAGAIDFTRRGFVTNVSPGFEDPIEKSSCVFCGMCIDNCPVGALIPKYTFGKGRPWQAEAVQAVCPYCSLGCNINLHVKDNEVIGVSPIKDSLVNRDHLCVKGKFGWDFVYSRDRVTAPLVKTNGTFVEVTWEEALDYIVDNFRDIQGRFGADSLMGLSSPKASNEDNYLFQKLIRSLGSNNVDSYTRHCHASSVDGLMEAFGNAATTNTIEEVAHTDAVLVIGGNPAESHPVLDYRVREAARKGAALTVANPDMIGLADIANYDLPLKPGTEVALVNGLANVIISEGLHDRTFVKERTEGFDQLKETVAKYTPQYVAEITGLDQEDIRAAAKSYASAEKAAIVSDASVCQQCGGENLVKALANLAMLTGNVGKESSGLYLPYGENNLQGAADMGALPNTITGYQHLKNKQVRDKFAEAWGVKISDKPGLSAADVFENDKSSPVKAMYIMGENPVGCGDDKEKKAELLKKLDFLVVQDIFMTETASLADVVLPAAAFAEKLGTYTNSERRVQLSQPAVEPPDQVFPDWAILVELAEWLGFDWDFADPEDVFAEIASLTPDYNGITYRRLTEQGLQWPCTDEKDQGTRVLHQDSFSRGKGLFSAVEYDPALAAKLEEHTAVCCRSGYHSCQCLSESMSKRSVINAFKESCCV
ncbi:MAG: molybdopterin-dependent oxidoreductase [Bacillota bacterium]